MNLNDALILIVADKLELLEMMECLSSSPVRACRHNPRKSGLRSESNNPFRTSPSSWYPTTGGPKLPTKRSTQILQLVIH
jgi:hypothetical protein